MRGTSSTSYSTVRELGGFGELAAPDHKYHVLFESVKDRGGACSYCAGAFGVKAAVEKSGVSLLDEFEGQPSLRRAVSDGYQVISF